MWSDDELARFRRVQRMAYDSVRQVERELHAGISEREAAARVAAAVQARGGRGWFHEPFAWFGERTAFRGFRLPTDFLPTNRRLEPGMAVILDVAPALDGFAADIGYAFAFGDNPLVERGLADLEPFRALLLDEVRAGRTLKQIYDRVDTLLRDLGYDNCHSLYPLGVLAHKVGRLRLTRLPIPSVGLGLEAVARLEFGMLRARFGRRAGTPIWNGRPLRDAPPSPGLWAIEPHLGKGDVGVKFEELLVIGEAGEARWLDDELPHVQRWRAASARAAS